MLGFLGKIHNNMAKYRVLIVDDQPDVRAVLKSGIETLNADINVVAVLSGEEAMLEIAFQSFDLLVADVGLPGITGLELLTKLGKRKLAMRVILITGLVNAKVRRAVAEAGVVACLLKPIELADFLDAVKQSLDLVEAAHIDQDIDGTEAPFESISARLIDLSQELNAITAIILDDRGRALFRAGAFPDASVETGLFDALLAVIGASNRVVNYLTSSPPNDLMYFASSRYDVFLAHIDTPYVLMIALFPLGVNDKFNSCVQIVRVGLQDLHKLFKQIDVPIASTEHTELQEEEIVVENADDAQVIEALFETKVALDGVDAFWDTVEIDSKHENSNIDVLSFEQAHQLGLTPDEPDEA